MKKLLLTLGTVAAVAAPVASVVACGSTPSAKNEGKSLAETTVGINTIHLNEDGYKIVVDFDFIKQGKHITVKRPAIWYPFDPSKGTSEQKKEFLKTEVYNGVPQSKLDDAELAAMDNLEVTKLSGNSYSEEDKSGNWYKETAAELNTRFAEASFKSGNLRTIAAGFDDDQTAASLLTEITDVKAWFVAHPLVAAPKAPAALAAGVSTNAIATGLTIAELATLDVTTDFGDAGEVATKLKIESSTVPNKLTQGNNVAYDASAHTLTVSFNAGDDVVFTLQAKA